MKQSHAARNLIPAADGSKLFHQPDLVMMNIEEIHLILRSRIFYNLANASMIRFSADTIQVDRRAAVPFSLVEHDGAIYLETPLHNRKEVQLLRIQTDHPDGSPFHFYEKDTNLEILILD